MGLIYVMSIVNYNFGNFLLYISLHFFTDFKLLIYRNNTENLSEILNKRNLLKSGIQTSYPVDFCIICNHFYFWKMECFDGFKQLNRIILFCIGNYENNFALNNFNKIQK